MGRVYDSITSELTAWIGAQRVFFVATAPLSAGGHLNCSPKGLDAFRVLSPRSVAYLDLTGSGIETVAHLRENGRVVLMFCAFEGPPKIVRLHGRGTVVTPDDPAFIELRRHFPAGLAGGRSVVHVEVTRVSDSCGFGVRVFEFERDREQLPKYYANKGDAGLDAYRRTKNAASIDGLKGLQRGPRHGRRPASLPGMTVPLEVRVTRALGGLRVLAFTPFPGSSGT